MQPQTRREFRIVGGVPEDVARIIEERFNQCLFEGKNVSAAEEAQQELSTHERKKTIGERALISLANRRTNALQSRASVSPYNVPEERIHIVDPDYYRVALQSAGKGYAYTDGLRQTIFVADDADMRKTPLLFGHRVLHEIFHLKGHVAIFVENSSGTFCVSAYRLGCSACSPPAAPKHTHFRGLEEALASMLERQFFDDLLRLPVFEKERLWLASENARQFKQRCAAENGGAEEDIVWVDPEYRMGYSIGYAWQRKALLYAARQIVSALPERHLSPESVVAEFMNAHFTGRYGPIAHLMRKAFGPFGFRALAMMDDDHETPATAWEFLIKLRAKQKRHSENAA